MCHDGVLVLAHVERVAVGRIDTAMRSQSQVEQRRGLGVRTYCLLVLVENPADLHGTHDEQLVIGHDGEAKPVCVGQ